MTVVLVVEGAHAADVTLALSPLAELGAALHALTETDHHAATQAWRAGLLEDLDPELSREIGRFAPLWAAYRARPLYPLSAKVATDISEELGSIERTPLTRFAQLMAYACAGGYSGLHLEDVLEDETQQERLLATARTASTARLELATSLLEDPAAFRDRLLRFLEACRSAFFDELWASVAPRLTPACATFEARLRHEDLGSVLASLSGTSRIPPDPPRRVVLDKFHHSVVQVAEEGLLLIPSWYGWPHVTFKHEPGLVPVVQFAVSGRGRVTSREQVHRRISVLSDARRMQLCRLIAREPLSTSALADRMSMTEPQVSRHLRRLRDAELVRAERDGRFVYYSLDVDAVARLGSDLLTALLQ